jgi:hypothetical protein
LNSTNGKSHFVSGGGGPRDRSSAGSVDERPAAAVVPTRGDRDGSTARGFGGSTALVHAPSARGPAPGLARGLPVSGSEPRQPTPHDRNRIAVYAGVDPKTVKRYLDGTVIPRSTTRARIEKSLAKCGFAECIRRAI